MNNNGFIKLNRSQDSLELVKDHNAFILLSVIALRARRKDTFNLDNLEPGEALLGDFRKYGLTEQKYRTAKMKLEKWNFATFRATNRGTIAKLLDSSVYDINVGTNNGQNNVQATDKQRLTRI
jgi:hypothetical protein